MLFYTEDFVCLSSFLHDMERHIFVRQISGVKQTIES